MIQIGNKVSRVEPYEPGMHPKMSELLTLLEGSAQAMVESVRDQGDDEVVVSLAKHNIPEFEEALRHVGAYPSNNNAYWDFRDLLITLRPSGGGKVSLADGPQLHGSKLPVTDQSEGVVPRVKKAPNLDEAQRIELATRWLSQNLPENGHRGGYLLQGKSAELIVKMLKTEYPGLDSLIPVYDGSRHSVVVAVRDNDERELELALFDDLTGRAEPMADEPLADVRSYNDKARAVAFDLFKADVRKSDVTDLFDRLLDENEDAILLH